MTTPTLPLSTMEQYKLILENRALRQVLRRLTTDINYSTAATPQYVKDVLNATPTKKGN